MISTGIAPAKASIRSTLRPASARACIASSSAPTSRASPPSSAVMWRGVSAAAMSRRTRVCNGGSLNTRLVVWCSKSDDSPYFGPNSSRLSELKVFASL